MMTYLWELSGLCPGDLDFGKDSRQVDAEVFRLRDHIGHFLRGGKRTKAMKRESTMKRTVKIDRHYLYEYVQPVFEWNATEYVNPTPICSLGLSYQTVMPCDKI